MVNLNEFFVSEQSILSQSSPTSTNSIALDHFFRYDDYAISSHSTAFTYLSSLV